MIRSRDEILCGIKIAVEVGFHEFMEECDILNFLKLELG